MASPALDPDVQAFRMPAAVLPLLVQTEAVILSRRLDWEAPLNMALSPEDLRPAP